MNPASSVVLFTRKPSDVNSITVLQWFLSRLFQEIKLGGAITNTYKFGASGEWVIIRISSAFGSDELLLPRVKKPKKAILSTSSTT
jgi:hypothetical protein